MSASMNLMGLVSQLQNMECAISSIIMESALKLASLTSASIFIAIETEDARRFTGSPNLVQTYLEGNFTPIQGRDLQIDVDLNARIVHEHPPQYFSTSMSSTNGSQHLALPSSMTTSSPSQTQQQQRPKPFMKRTATASGGVGGSTAAGISDSPSTPPKRRKSVDSPFLFLPKIEDQKPDLNTDGTLSRDSSSRVGGLGDGGVGNLADDVALAGDVDDDDSDIEVLESVSFMDDQRFDDSSASAASASSSSGMRMMMNPSNSNSNMALARQDNAVAQGFVPVDVSQNQMKIDALRSIENPLLAFQKGTAESRLMTSVFYDFGRNLREACPFDVDLKSDKTKTYLKQSVSQFLSNFPNLSAIYDSESPVSQCRVPVGALTLKPEAFLRMNARAGFVSACKKAAKRLSNINGL